MASGSLQQIIVCSVKDQQIGPSIAPCADVSGVFQQPVMMQAYVLDSGSQTLVDSVVAPFDYTVAGAIWMMVFTFVVGLYVATSQVGLLLNLIRGR
ncbi:hypothetical protein [Janthinobacterium sp. HLX7-2]|uniref:hypothetical protein n=1 Tax=Janthinobacterium sp. HLX7-2 TaxID=1259331 RepID=UPI003F2242D8